MKAKELRELTKEELDRRLGEAKREIFNLKFRATTEKLENPARLRLLRRDIARIYTVINERGNE